MRIIAYRRIEGNYNFRKVFQPPDVIIAYRRIEGNYNDADDSHARVAHYSIPED